MCIVSVYYFYTDIHSVFGRGEIEAREKGTREIAKKHGTSFVWFSAENEESD
jgi:hypothetical protein